MLKKILVAGAMLAIAATPAFASHHSSNRCGGEGSCGGSSTEYSVNVSNTGSSTTSTVTVSAVSGQNTTTSDGTVVTKTEKGHFEGDVTTGGNNGNVASTSTGGTVVAKGKSFTVQNATVVSF